MADLTIWDFILLPLYLFILNLIAKLIRSPFKDDAKLTFYFKWGFRFKMLLVIIFTLLVNFVMRGDSIELYYGVGKNFAKIIGGNVSKIDLLFTQGGATVNDLNLGSNGEGYLKSESNYMVVKVCILLCFFTFSKYLLINLLCAFVAFVGSWRLFLFFREQRPNLEKEFAFACMFVPTVVFWSGGISKDVICMASIGFLTWGLWKIIKHKQKIFINLCIVTFCGYLNFTIKPYILYSYLPFCAYYQLSTYISTIKNNGIKLAFKYAMLILIVGAIGYVFTSDNEIFSSFTSDEILKSVSNTQDSFLEQAKTSEGSFFSLGDFDGTPQGFIKMTPSAVGTTLFRPFIWEARSLIMLLSAMESLLILWLAIKNLYTFQRIIIFLKSIFTDKLVVYCFLFSIIFSAFVGISTYNFGSLVRYKIPAIPFFIIALFVISDNYKKRITLKKTITNK